MMMSILLLYLFRTGTYPVGNALEIAEHLVEWDVNSLLILALCKTSRNQRDKVEVVTGLCDAD